MRRLVRRDSQPNLSFSSPAIYCGDSVDLRGTTMEEVFKSVISTTQNVSHLGEYLIFFPLASLTELTDDSYAAVLPQLPRGRARAAVDCALHAGTRDNAFS